MGLGSVLGFSISSSSIMGEIEGFICLGSNEIRIEVLKSIDNFWTTVAAWSLVKIGDGGMGDIGFAGELDRGVEKDKNNFLAMGEGGGVHSRDESMTIFFPLSFLKFLDAIGSWRSNRKDRALGINHHESRVLKKIVNWNEMQMQCNAINKISCVDLGVDSMWCERGLRVL